MPLNETQKNHLKEQRQAAMQNLIAASQSTSAGHHNLSHAISAYQLTAIAEQLTVLTQAYIDVETAKRDTTKSSLISLV